MNPTRLSYRIFISYCLNLAAAADHLRSRENARVNNHCTSRAKRHKRTLLWKANTAHVRRYSAREPDTTRDTRPSDRSAFPRQGPKSMKQQRVPNEFWNPHQRVQILRRPIVHPLDVKRGVKGGPPHFDDTHSAKRKAGRYAMHGCSHNLPVRDARRCADSVLEVAEMGAHYKRATAWACALRERNKPSSWEERSEEEFRKEKYAQFTPAQNVFSRAEDGTARGALFKP